jgi:hypothetical protein
LQDEKFLNFAAANYPQFFQRISSREFFEILRATNEKVSITILTKIKDFLQKCKIEYENHIQRLKTADQKQPDEQINLVADEEDEINSNSTTLCEKIKWRKLKPKRTNSRFSNNCPTRASTSQNKILSMPQNVAIQINPSILPQSFPNMLMPSTSGSLILLNTDQLNVMENSSGFHSTVNNQSQNYSNIINLRSASNYRDYKKMKAEERIYWADKNARRFNQSQVTTQDKRNQFNVASCQKNTLSTSSKDSVVNSNYNTNNWRFSQSQERIPINKKCFGNNRKELQVNHNNDIASISSVECSISSGSTHTNIANPANVSTLNEHNNGRNHNNTPSTSSIRSVECSISSGSMHTNIANPANVSTLNEHNNGRDHNNTPSTSSINSVECSISSGSTQNPSRPIDKSIKFEPIEEEENDIFSTQDRTFIKIEQEFKLERCLSETTESETETCATSVSEENIEKITNFLKPDINNSTEVQIKEEPQIIVKEEDIDSSVEEGSSECSSHLDYAAEPKTKKLRISVRTDLHGMKN